MCFGPEALAALAATAAGNYIQSSDNNASLKAQYNAKNAAMLQGIDQQHQNQAAASDVLDPTVKGFTAPNQQADLGSLIANRSATINAGNDIPSTGNTTSAVSSAPQVVQNTIAQKFADAAGYNKQQGDALATLGATNDQMLNNSLNVNTAQQKIGTIDNFARAQYGVNQAQQEAAFNNARKSPSFLGSALSDVGTVLGLDSAVGGGGLNGALSTISGPTAATFDATSLPWRNTVFGLDAGPKFPIPATQLWS